MKMSHLFGNTLRDIPVGTEAASHQLLLRAGFIRQLGQGIFSNLPLAKRSLNKVENIMRQEINRIDGQEMLMPVVHPAEPWKATGRWYSVGPEMVRLKDRREKELVLAMTHEEVVVDLCKSEIRSHRQLPQLIYHIQTKFRDDPRPRAGLIRVREFTMLDSYSLDVDEDGLERQYRAHYQAYTRIFHRCGIPVLVVGSDVGMMGGSGAHEFMYLTPVGEDALVLCPGCGYAANRQIARQRKEIPPIEEAKPLTPVETPHMSTIDDLARYLEIPKSKTAKAVFLVAGYENDTQKREEFLFAVIRGDMEVNETKLSHAVGANWLRPATEEEIRATGAIPGYASPIGLNGITVVVDEGVKSSRNLVAGANREGFHMLNTNLGRDYQATVVTDIATVSEGDACPQCGTPLHIERGVEVGNIFKLGTHYSEAVGARFLAADGGMKPIVMGSYGIGSGRLLACVAEEHHDEYGLKWPISIAPFHVHLVSLLGKSPEVQEITEKVYLDLTAKGIEVLHDDRDDSPGVKFADADLIGVPIRITISQKSLANGGVEFKRRDRVEKEIIPLASVEARAGQEISQLYKEMEESIPGGPPNSEE